MLRSLSLSRTMGPMIIMLYHMFIDALKWMVLVLVIFVGVTAAFTKLFIGGEPDCVSRDFYPGQGGVVGGITLLLRPLFGSDDVAYLSCQEEFNHLASVPFLMLTYALLAMVVLMNMCRVAPSPLPPPFCSP